MVKPVDLQDNLSKTQLLEKITQLQKSTPEEAQKNFAQEFQKKVAEGKQRVKDAPKSDKIIITRDEKRKEDHKNKQQAKEDDEDANSNSESSEEQGDSKKNETKKIDYIA